MSEKSKNRPFFFVPASQPGDRTSWQPATDIYRTARGWLLKFELAGVTRDDVAIEVNGSRLTVHGARRDLMVEECCTYYSLEIAYNRFERTIELPCDLEQAVVEYEFRNGILLVRVTTQGGQP
jgi:HSP20 family protein